jgi:hypothetical protein
MQDPLRPWRLKRAIVRGMADHEACYAHCRIANKWLTLFWNGKAERAFWRVTTAIGCNEGRLCWVALYEA